MHHHFSSSFYGWYVQQNSQFYTCVVQAKCCCYITTYCMYVRKYEVGVQRMIVLFMGTHQAIVVTDIFLALSKVNFQRGSNVPFVSWNSSLGSS